MKQIIKVIKVRCCEECQYSHGAGCGGFFGNSNGGGYSAHCGKMHNKNISCHLFGGKNASQKEALEAFVSDLKKITPWCPLDDYKRIKSQRRAVI